MEFLQIPSETLFLLMITSSVSSTVLGAILGYITHIRALKWSVFLITERLVAFTSKHLLE